MMEGQYVRALYDFVTEEAGEICLNTGDVVRVKRQVDSNWLCGELNSKTGNFPASFVAPVETPQLKPGEKLFLATRSFPAEMEGDLGFKKGELIVATEAVDSNWWKGVIGTRTGIFPTTHVHSLPVDNNTPAPPRAPPAVSARANHVSGSGPQDPPPGGGFIARARATMDLTAQLDDELSFLTGDIIDITEVIDDDFCVGACGGRSGQFPVSFVEVIEGKLPAKHEEKRRSKFRWWLDEEAENETGTTAGGSPADVGSGSTAAHTPALPPSSGVPEGTSVNRNGITPSASASPSRTGGGGPPVEDSAGSAHANVHRRTGSYTQENTRSHDADIRPYAQALFPFLAENPNELTILEGDIITLIRHVDDQWLEGATDNRRGIFPTAYVKIIVDCSYPESEPNQADRPPRAEYAVGEKDGGTAQKPLPPRADAAELGQPQNYRVEENGPRDDQPDKETAAAEEEKYALVLYNLTPSSPQELAITEGDTITILGEVDEHWLQARHDDGRVGLCPSTYVQLIESDPCQASSPATGTSPSKPAAAAADEDKTPAGPAITGPSPDHVTSHNDRQESQDNKGSAERTAETGSPAHGVKPQLKPKPSLKPKPVLTAQRSRSPLTTSATDPASVTKTPSEVSLAAKRRTVSLDSNDNLQPAVIHKPVAPARRSGTGKAPPPVVQKASSVDATTTTLDDLIVGEMNALKHEMLQSRSSSATSDYSSIEESGTSRSSTGNKSMQPPSSSSISASSTTESAARSPDEKYMQRGTAVGSSMFFASATSPTSSKSNGARPTLEQQQQQRPRPTPSRPPPPPVGHTPPPQLPPPPSSAVARRPPPRPSGPRTSPVPPRVEPSIDGSGVDYGPRPVPSRPAPPRPNSRPPLGLTRQAAGNWVDFSCDGPPVGLSEQDQKIVADLDNRIAEIQKDLEKCMQARQEAEQQLVGLEDGEDREESEETLAFYNANITGLTEEMQQVKASLYELDPRRAQAEAEAEEREKQAKRHAEELQRRAEKEQQQQEESRQKRRDTRDRVIGEILQTERDYIHSLTLTMETYLSPEIEKCASIDLEMLFGNMDEVIEVSQKLLTSLETGTNGRDFDSQLIGESFVSMKEDMKKVYAPYCRNHDDVIALLEKYEENEEIQDYFGRMLELLRQRVTAFDLGSMLIKPVQRILKYPLLLNELIKSTEEGHVDKQPLLNAINAMTDVAAAINEYKRRKDLVLKYREDRDQKLTDKISRLSVHSTKKMFSRITQRMVGIQTVDEAYNKEERKVTVLEKGVRSLLRDISQFLLHLQDTVSLQESVANDIADYYGERSGQQEVQHFSTVHNIIASNLFHKFKFEIETEVLEPLNRLLMMLSGPAKVMKKRHDKLLDYDNARGKLKSAKESEQVRLAQADVQRTKNNYEALNAQLLDELPRLYALSIDIVLECLTRLITVQKKYYQGALDEMFQLLALPLLLGSDGAPLIETFNIAHVSAVEALSDLSFIPRTFNPRIEEHRPASRPNRRISSTHSTTTQDSEMTQSDGQRVYLTQIYPPDQLYRVVVDAASSQPMDLQCSAGTVIGVIKEGDPMGNKDRWFVDNGVIKGFILKRYLAPYQAAVAAAGPAMHSTSELLKPTASPGSPSSSAQQAATNTGSSPGGTVTGDLMDLSSPPRETPPKAEPLPLDLDLLQPAEGKIDLNAGSPPVQSIDWGIPVSRQSTLSASNASGSYEEQAEPSPPPAYSEYESQPATQGEAMYYTAVYPFAARAPIEVSMEEGQVVTVLQQHDLDGNTEWWLVDVNGKQGYAPANYLYRAQ